MQIGDIEIKCAVLENGKRVVTANSVNDALGRNPKKASTIACGNAVVLPNFLCNENLHEFIDQDLIKLCKPINYRTKTGGKGIGFDASMLPKVCEVYLKARDADKLKPRQLSIAYQCEIMVRALSHVGIAALIDESTGFQRVREQDELQKLFTAFIAKELQPYVKRFPAEFFLHLKRIYGIKEMKGNPSFFGHLINRWIYKELNADVFKKLKEINPVGDNGLRRYPHHRLLTQEVGCPALEKQVTKVTTLMAISDNREQFEEYLQRSKKVSE